jgi:fatty-acyl-CoA synthase
VVLRPGVAAGDGTTVALLDHLEPRVPRWWIPDDVVFLDSIPKTSVGKFSKKDLRSQLARSGTGRREEAPR